MTNEKGWDNNRPIMEKDLEVEKIIQKPMIIAVANQKGGVAKTTTTFSLAGAFVQQGYEVLLIDLDPQANLTLSLGINARNNRGSMSDVFLHSDSMKGISRESTIQGLDIIPSNEDMLLIERFLPIRRNYECILHEALNSSNQFFKDIYDFIILDCPPSLGAITINAINAAQLLIIPTQPEYYSINAIRGMMNTIRNHHSQKNKHLVIKILITMMDHRNKIHRSLAEQIQQTFSEGLFDTIIEVDTKLRESSLVGLPISFYNNRTRATLQYNTLAEELIQYVQ
jgi:chromosome partitioning protein